MPRLTVYGPTGPPHTYRFDKESVCVGRSSANDLVLHDPTLSRIHAQIRMTSDGAWVVEDRQSRNGTLLNGMAVSCPTVLSPGDEIQLGELRLVFAESTADVVEESAGRDETLSWSDRGTGLGSEELVIVGVSEPMRKVFALIEQIAPSTASVLITGENGTGKELAARLIHSNSPRAEGPFVVVNCPALPESLIESELFGVEKGVATGVDPRAGRFELANGGTLLLDEIGDMDLVAQSKLLRVLEERVVERVGGRATLPVDVRVLATTHHDLQADIEEGGFRRDLYHRLKTVSVVLAPLRERREDIPLLVRHFLSRLGRPPNSMSPEALALLMRYEYPGNVRELEHMVEAAGLLAPSRAIEAYDLPSELARGKPGKVEGPDATCLYDKIVLQQECFWEVVQKPFLRRELSREAVHALMQRAWDETGSYKKMSELFRIQNGYKKFLNFLHYHGLRIDRSGN